MYLRLLSTVSANPPLPTAIVFGVGDGIGSSTVTKFVSKGYNVIGVRRTPNSLTELQNTLDDADFEGQFYPMDSIDARKEEDVEAVFTRANDLPGPLECVVHNIGANITFPITETTSRKFSKCWEMACFSGFLVGREAARHMKIDPALPPPHPRSILFTGATASVRGSANFAAFAVAKSGLRALSQSLARELGPKQQIHGEQGRAATQERRRRSGDAGAATHVDEFEHTAASFVRTCVRAHTCV